METEEEFNEAGETKVTEEVPLDHYQKGIHASSTYWYSKSYLERFYLDHIEPIIFPAKIWLRQVIGMIKRIVQLKFEKLKNEIDDKRLIDGLQNSFWQVVKEYKCVCCKKSYAKYHSGVVDWKKYLEAHNIDLNCDLICSRGAFRYNGVPEHCVDRDPVSYCEIEKYVDLRVANIYRLNARLFPEAWDDKYKNYSPKFLRKLRIEVEQVTKIMRRYYKMLEEKKYET